MLKVILARLIGLVEDGYTLTWEGRKYVRLPDALVRNQVAPPLPDESPLTGDEFLDMKREATLSVMDDDTHGFILLTLKKEGASGDIRIHGHMPVTHQAALYATIARILVDGQKMHEQRVGS